MIKQIIYALGRIMGATDSRFEQAIDTICDIPQYAKRVWIWLNHTYRILWHWYLRAGFNRNVYTYEIKITESSVFLNFEESVPGYEITKPHDWNAPIRSYLGNENYLSPAFKSWLHETGSYKVILWRVHTYGLSPRDCRMTVYFRTEAQLALFKLTWA